MFKGLSFNLKSFKRLSNFVSSDLAVFVSTSFHKANARTLFTTSANLLREIQVNTEGDVTVVEGVQKQSIITGVVLENKCGKDVCPLCPLRIPVPVKYTDVLILSQFVRADGCVYPRHVTGLCLKAQRRLQRLVHQAQRAGLMPELRPDLPNNRLRTSVHSNYKWRKYNTFFDE